MKVTMQTLMAGPSVLAKPGQTIDVSAAQAKALIDGGYAVKVEGKQPKEADGGTQGQDGAGQ